MKRVLLGQLGSNGDCLYATTIARQIRADFPGCHLTWAISSLCRGVIENNPDVDAIWDVQLGSWADMNPTWHLFEQEAWSEVQRGRFDHAFLTQISPDHFANYDGTIRPSLFRNYPYPITVPVETVINLTDDEKQRVDDWTRSHRVRSYDKVVIFECSSKSGQSFVTPALALDVAEHVLARNPNVCFILSTHEKVASSRPAIMHGGALSLRETAALTAAASVFVGCGSGVTVAATSSAAKPNLPNIQILKESSSVFASFRHDFEYFGKPSGHFLETTSSDSQHLAQIVITALGEGIAAASDRYHQTIPITFGWYFDLIERMPLRQRRYLDAAQSLMTTARRYGWREDLVRFGDTSIWPYVRSDARAQFPHGQAIVEQFAHEIDTAHGQLGLEPSAAASRAVLKPPGSTQHTDWTSGRSLGIGRFRHAVGHWLRTRHPHLYDLVARAERFAWRMFH